MAHPLDGAFLKTGRARQHLKTLNLETRAWIDAHPYRLNAEKDDQTGHHIVRIHPPSRGGRIPLALGLMAGDAVHNMRSALVHLTWALASPPVGSGPGRSTQFPIFEDLDDYRSKERGFLKGVPERHWVRFEALQPYHARDDFLANRPVARTLRANILLMIVGRLDNMDKHRLLLAAHAVSPHSPSVFGPGVLHVEIQTPGDWVRVNDGAELFRITKITLAPGAKMELKKLQSMTIGFGDPDFRTRAELWNDRHKGMATRADLQIAANEIDAIIGSFNAEFP